jgi:hypothetical protein
MDTRLRNLLHDLASEMPVELERSARPTLRKARRRRAVSAAGAVVAVVAFVAVGVSALRLVSEPTVPATTGPNPTADPFPALWPETDAQALAQTQAAVDEGHMPLRTTPVGTATLFATNLLGWPTSDDPNGLLSSFDVREDDAEVVLTNPLFGDDVGVIVVDLRQLGDTGPDGAWSIVGVSEPPVQWPPVIQLDSAEEVGRGLIRISGRVDDLFDGAPAIEAHVFDGPTLEPSLGSSRHELLDRSFEFEVEVAPTPDGEATLLLTMPDATGASLGAVMVPVETPVGEPEPTPGPDVEGVPPDVAVTAQRIYDAAKARDFDALAELIGPDGIDYNVEPGANPIPAWQGDPSELDLMVAILEMPPTSRDIGPGYGTIYFWPYLVNSDFENLTPEERADLAELGYTDEDIQLIIDGGTGYQGPRLAIDEDGEWRNFLTVGE